MITSYYNEPNGVAAMQGGHHVPHLI